MSEQRPHLGQLNLQAQGNYKRALFVCSGGMLRSATSSQWAACALHWNTRNCGTMEAALPPAHANLLEWAEYIYCMEERHKAELIERFPWAESKMVVMEIPDIFSYRSQELIALLEKYFATDLVGSP